MEKNEESASEDFIADFLEEKGIEFKRYPELPKLIEDNKFFRKPDFYLPEYKVYLEFLGQWNNPEHKMRYKQKMAVYHKNRIPCIYLWPDNLGTLEWMFKRRLRETLLKYNKKWTLLKYELENYWSEDGFSILMLGALIYYIKDIRVKIGLGFVLIWTMYSNIKKYIERINKIKKSKWVSGSDYNNQSTEESREN